MSPNAAALEGAVLMTVHGLSVYKGIRGVSWGLIARSGRGAGVMKVNTYCCFPHEPCAMSFPHEISDQRPRQAGRQTDRQTDR
jgi:hypothetical protein